MLYNLIYIQTDILDPNIYGSDKLITFECENFTYTARCFEGKLQYVKGDKPRDYNSWPSPPTEEEIEAHHQRRKTFNQDHSIIQNWIDENNL